jgi:phosphatidylinositol alpha-1,6-mannosyltransferase
MRILFVSPEFETNYGGVQASARIAWTGLCEAESICEAELFTYDAGQAKLISKLSFLSRACRLHAGFDVIFFWHLALLKALPFLRTGAAQVAVFLHGIEAWQPIDGITSRLLRKTNLLLHNSEHTWRRFLQANPIFADHSHQRVALGIGSPADENVPEPAVSPAALMLGRLDPRENYKGHQEVIEAWPLVRSVIPNAELWIAGNGPLIASLKNVGERLGLQACVRFFGTVSEEQKELLLSRSRCLALPSRGEGFGLAYLEAMRLGRPCLVSQSDAGREVVAPPEAGIAVNVEDRTAIAAALVQLMRDGHHWKTLSQNARRRYETQFTADRFQCRLVRALVAGQRIASSETVLT